MKIFRTTTLITIALLAVFALSACGNSAEKLNQTGNEAYVQQAYEDALADYQSAQNENPELAEPHYNAANALYRSGDYAGALEELEKALTLATGGEEAPLEVAEAAHFNAGNSSYNTQELDAAIDAYRQALLMNPNDLDAKYNLELALQQQQEQQDQQQDQNQDENQDQQDQQNQDQQNQDEQNQDQQDQDQQNQDQQNQDEQNQDEQNQDQQSQDEQNQDEQNQDEQNQDQQQKEGDQQQNDGQPQDEQQQDGQQQPGQGDEPQPADEDPNGQPSYAPAPGERMSEEQARQLLAAIAGDSDTLMERLGQILYVNMRPPAQDW
jgi:Ca-activated chloride channel family protein